MTHHITDPLTLNCGIEFPNRVLMAPMTTLNGSHDGISSDGIRGLIDAFAATTARRGCREAKPF